YGVSTTYADVWGTPRYASEETLLRTLQLLGAPLDRADQAADAVHHRRQHLWRECIEPVLVAWDGRLTSVHVRLPEAMQAATYQLRLDLEDGGLIEFDGQVSELPVCSRCELAGERYQRRRIALGLTLPRGYHRLRLSVGNREAESLIIAAPTRAFGDAAANQERLWGVFLPLHALHRQSSHGAGDFSDLEALMQWTAARGGNLVATLPLLSTLWELTDDPSPYNPASRLFWNEFYLAPNQIAGFEASGHLSELHEVCPPPIVPEATEYVDYPREMARKRQVLETLAARFFAEPSARREALAEYCRKNPEAERFAQFRAVGERQGQAWPHWPEPLCSGTLSPDDYDRSVFHYHLFTQWQVDEQLEALAGHAQRLNLLWYLDFPLGVAGTGYDVWREPNLFVREASGGAPPDSFFTKGQNWGFPPLHPDRLRRQGYDYFIRALRNHLRHARLLRFDHVMGLYRLYWIPHGFPATEGAYVRYPMDELCAILTLESHRFGASIVGENLGTVPAAVDEALSRHGLDDMYVLQYETNPEKGPTLRLPPATAVASVNTHDMPQFAAYWRGLDIDDRVDLGLLTAKEAAAEHVRRADLRAQLVTFLQAEHLLDSATPDVLDVLEACQAYLAGSPARIVQVNLEDLWGETEPQNRPGTYRERPNWRHKAKYPLDVFTEMPIVQRILDTVHRRRQQ
ncbi:MAG: 4-alpha-glucanotransferase, partial [Patescibacteria group bacterium]|nr:4-alpha-glucanotransferase [Patescibacteria group bacterium]